MRIVVKASTQCMSVSLWNIKTDLVFEKQDKIVKHGSNINVDECNRASDVPIRFNNKMSYSYNFGRRIKSSLKTCAIEIGKTKLGMSF